MLISKYSDFLLEKEFQSILREGFLLESEGRWIDDRTIEWDIEPEDNSILTKAKRFVEKLPLDKVKPYFIRLMNSLKSLPEQIRKKLIIGYTSIFLAVVGLNHLVSPTTEASAENLDPKIKKEIIILNKKDQKSSFDEAQKLVKTAEGGYSNDRGDTGNWIDVPGGKRFVGSKHGISAPILADYLGRLPKKEDMMNLSYKTALKIYKKNYWDSQNLSDFTNQSVANIIYDGCVNQGIPGMRSVLRNAYEENGIKVEDTDNIFGTELIKKANEVDQEKLFESIKKFREERYKGAETWARHGEGWMNRLDAISYASSDKQSDLT